MFTEAAWQAFLASILMFLPRLATGVAVFLLLWLSGGAARRLVVRAGRVHGITPGLADLLGRAAKLALIAFGAVTALGTLGLDVTALVAGLGLTGLALGLALKDILSNAVSGILLLLYKPFAPGDRVSVTALEGTVAEVNLRYTVLDAEGRRIFIPNATLFTNPLTVEVPSRGDPPS